MSIEEQIVEFNRCKNDIVYFAENYMRALPEFLSDKDKKFLRDSQKSIDRLPGYARFEPMMLGNSFNTYMQRAMERIANMNADAWKAMLLPNEVFNQKEIMKNEKQEETLEPRVPKLMPLPWTKEKDLSVSSPIDATCPVFNIGYSFKAFKEIGCSMFEDPSWHRIDYNSFIHFVEKCRNESLNRFLDPNSFFNEKDVEIIEKFAWDSAEDYMKAGVNPERNGPNRDKTMEEVVCYMDGYYHAMKCVRDAMRLPETSRWKNDLPKWFIGRWLTNAPDPFDHILASPELVGTVVNCRPIDPTPPTSREYEAVAFSMDSDGENATYIKNLLNDGWEPDRNFGNIQMFSREKPQK